MLRFAPSPTGDMNVESLRIALINYIVAKQRSEDLIIRIEDLDNGKNIEGKDAEIIALLDLFGIKYRDVLYQSKNFKFHQAMAVDLLHRKKGFNCFCTPEELEMQKEIAKANKQPYRYDGRCESLPAEEVIDNPKPFTVRIKKPLSPISFTDKIQGKFEFMPEDVDSFIILEVDKTPTYNFASAVDDMLSDISIVIRAQEHLNNTPKQIHIRQEIGYTKEIEYAHLPNIENSSDLNVKWLLEEGFLPEAISNYLISIGNRAPQEIFTLEDAIQWFDLEQISQSPVKFDMDKLRSINKEHLKKLDDKELSRYVGFADAEIGKLAKLYLEEVSTTKELKEKVTPIFQSKEIPQQWQESVAIVREIIKESPYFDVYEDFENYLIEKSGFTKENVVKSLQYILTGSEGGPKVQDIYMAVKNYLQEVIK